jgi:hypothetical protein
VKRLMFVLAGAGALLAFAATAAADHSADFHSPNVVHVANDKNDEPMTGGAINSDLAFSGRTSPPRATTVVSGYSTSGSPRHLFF